MTLREKLIGTAVAVVGAISFGVVALSRGEPVNAAWLVAASVCIYFIAYRFYALFIANEVFRVDARRVTPAYRHNDGLDYVPTNRYVLFGHHFAAIAGAGPLVGPVLAAQMGYLPGTLWILAGVVFAGAVQDLTVLFLSVRRDGKSLGDMIRSEMGPVAGGRRRHWRALDLRHRPRRAGARGGQCVERQPLGRLHGVLHPADCGDHGRLQPVHPPRADRRDVADRRRAVAGRARLRPNSVGDARAGRLVQPERARPGADRHRLRFRRFGAAGLAGPGAARLSVNVPQDWHHHAAGDRHRHRAARSARCPR